MKEERQRVSQLQEEFFVIKDRLEKEQQRKAELEREIQHFQGHQKVDNDVQDIEVEKLNLTVQSLRADLEKLQQTLQNEKMNVKEIAEERNMLKKKIEVLNEELKKQRLASVESEEENNMLKEKLIGVKQEKEKQQEEYVCSETKEKVKLGEAERKLSCLTEKLEGELKIKMELIEKNEEFEEKLRREVDSRKIAQSSVDDMKKEKEATDKLCEELKSQNDKLQHDYTQYKGYVKKTVDSLEVVHRKKDSQIKEYKEKLSERDMRIKSMEEQHEVQLESLKMELLIVEDKCAKLRVLNTELEECKKVDNELKKERDLLNENLQDMRTKYQQVKSEAEKLNEELSRLRLQLSALENRASKEKYQILKQVTKPSNTMIAGNAATVNMGENIKPKGRESLQKPAEEKAGTSYRTQVNDYENQERTKDRCQSQTRNAKEKIKSQEDTKNSSLTVTKSIEANIEPNIQAFSGSLWQEIMPKLVSPCSSITRSISNLDINSKINVTSPLCRLSRRTDVTTSAVSNSELLGKKEPSKTDIEEGTTVSSEAGIPCEMSTHHGGVTRKTSMQASDPGRNA